MCKHRALVIQECTETCKQQHVHTYMHTHAHIEFSDNLLVMDTPPKHIHPDSASDLLTCSPSTFNATTVVGLTCTCICGDVFKN